MIHRHSLSVLTFFIVYLAMLTSGCSETTKKAPALPDVVFPVYFPYIENSSLFTIENSIEYGVTPEENQTNSVVQKFLLESPTGLILALDTDQSIKSIDDTTQAEVFKHSALPEYIAYATKQTLHLYDLSTRYDHKVYSFESDEFFEPDEETTQSPSMFICDLQKVITWDEESRLSKKILFKDELAVYVKTSTLENCSEPTEGFQYWQINIDESTDEDETFKIRRRFLKEHTHYHRHFHDHDNENDELYDEHNHTHTLIEGELDENGEAFKPNDHKHKHTHVHEFLYGSQHEHEHLTAEEIDEVHNNPQNHEIEFETHPKLVGKRTSISSIDEALMYSGTPVTDISTRNFGYLGLNTKESSLKFYSVNFDTLEKRLIWSQTSDQLSGVINSPRNGLDWGKLVPSYSRPGNFISVSNGIALFVNNKLLNFSLDSLFDDDDQTGARQASISSPLFTSLDTETPLGERARFNPIEQKMAIADNKQVWVIDFNTFPATKVLVKTFNEVNLQRIEALILGNDILVVKHFAENEVFTTSVTSIDNNGLEVSTVIPKTSDQISIFPKNNEILITTLDNVDGTIKSKYLLDSLYPLFSELLNTLWVANSLDYRNNTEKEIISQLSSDNMQIIANTIEQPVLYIVDKEAVAGRGEEFIQVNDAIKNAYDFVIFNEFYSILSSRNSNDEIFYDWIITQY